MFVLWSCFCLCQDFISYNFSHLTIPFSCVPDQKMCKSNLQSCKMPQHSSIFLTLRSLVSSLPKGSTFPWKTSDKNSMGLILRICCENSRLFYIWVRVPRMTRTRFSLLETLTDCGLMCESLQHSDLICTITVLADKKMVWSSEKQGADADSTESWHLSHNKIQLLPSMWFPEIQQALDNAH